MLNGRFAHTCSPLGMESVTFKHRGTVRPVRLSSRSTSVCAPGHKASPSMASKTQQVSALGAGRLTWCGSRVTGPNSCDGRNSASAATPCGLRVFMFWTSDLSGPSWQKERGTRT